MMMMRKVKKNDILKQLADEDDQVEKGDYFNCFTDNYLIHTLEDKSFMTQWFVDNESTQIEMDITVIRAESEHTNVDGSPKKSSLNRDKDFVPLSEFKQDDDSLDIVHEQKFDMRFLDLDRKPNDYALLRKALSHNFPGLYIPKIPEKRSDLQYKKIDEKNKDKELKKMQL